MTPLPSPPTPTDDATRRSLVAAWTTIAGVIATGGSTLALIHAAHPSAHAPVAWAVVFFASAQVAAVCTALVLLQALRISRSSDVAGADLALLCRRCGLAFVATGFTMLAAGGAASGQASPVVLIGGPALACLGAALTLRARAAVRRLEGARRSAHCSPYADLSALTGLRIPAAGPLAIAALAAVGAFLRDRGEAGATSAGSLGVAGIELALVLGAYLSLRGPLGLRQLRPRAR
jgi:hypothetical protein